MYQLDIKSAREAEQWGKYLSETGKYKGRFIRAEKLISQARGTHGIGFTFEDMDGKQCRFDVWTMSASGERFSGWNMINAMMVCLRVRALSEQEAQIERYDFDARQTVKARATVFPELMGRDIGMVLVKTEYEKFSNGHPTGETAWRLEPMLPFDAQGEFTAAEILDKKTQPERLGQIVASLADRPLRKKPTPAAHGGKGYGQEQQSGHAAAQDPFDESDIPF